MRERERLFLELVTNMRSAQKRYFQTRDRDDLNESKRLERQVDDHIRRTQNPELFV